MSANDRQETDSSSVAELFNLVGSLIPEGQRVSTAPPNMKVADALQIMSMNNFSQLPVVAGNAVLGVFSFRSLAQRLLKMRQVPEDVMDLPVDEFVEHFQFVQPSDNWESILKYLDREDGVLVGQRERLEGILTPMDVLGYLHRIASPFVMLAEIELSLRRIVRACVNEDELRTCILNSLAHKYEDTLPEKLSEMTFNDYVQIIGDGRNWPNFTTVFGEGEWQRKTTAQRLKQVGDLRNEVFHFRREIDSRDLEILSARRDWLQMKARAFEGVRAGKEAPGREKPKPPKKRKGKTWDESSFLRDLEERRSSEQVAVARKIFEWSKERGLILRWGRGKTFGTCYPSMKNEPCHAIFSLWSSGYAELQLGYLWRFPPFNDRQKRAEWLHRVESIPGVSVSETETGKFPSLPLSDLADPAALDGFLASVDWVMAEIERVAAGPEGPTHDDYLGVLTHILVPRGQQQLYKALYDAGDDGLTHDQLVEAMGRRDRQDLAGVLGALGRRISGVPGYGQARRPGVEMVISYEQFPDGQQRLRLVPEMRKALEELSPSWLHEMTP